MNTAIAEKSICWIALEPCPYQSGLSGTLALGDVSLSICKECSRFKKSQMQEEMAEMMVEVESAEEILERCDNDTLLEHLDYEDENLAKKLLEIWLKNGGDLTSISTILLEAMQKILDYELPREESVEKNPITPLTAAQQKKVNAATALLRKCYPSATAAVTKE